jgi:protein-disulfide isomerase
MGILALTQFYCKYFFTKISRTATMSGMPKLLKPLIVIIIAVAVAAGAAVYLSRQPDKPADTAGAPTHADIKGGGHIRGPENATLTLVEFGDYQCPSCGAYHPLVKEILNRYPQQLRLEFHHFPLVTVHPNSMLASQAVEAAGEQGKYWEMHDAVFDHQMEWAGSPNAEPIFITLASGLGLDINKFMQSMRSPEVQTRILKDVERGQEAKVEAVPTFFMNGEQIHVRLSMEDFVQAVESHLHK